MCSRSVRPGGRASPPLARHAVAKVDDSRAEGAALDEWIRAAENVCLMGPAGTGKSHSLVGLGVSAPTFVPQRVAVRVSAELLASSGS